ncbi:MAG: hypothetical protein ABIG95_01165 [Candidatus Woesearchaeota archaeon]
MARIYIICPVKGITEEESKFLHKYVENLEKQGHKVHLPPRDTSQVDELKGYNICCRNFEAILDADEIHYYYNSSSTGSYFDFGISFYEFQLKKKPIKLINREAVLKAIKDGKKTRGLEFVALTIDEWNKPK